MDGSQKTVFQFVFTKFGCSAMQWLLVLLSIFAVTTDKINLLMRISVFLIGIFFAFRFHLVYLTLENELMYRYNTAKNGKKLNRNKRRKLGRYKKKHNIID